MKKYCKEKTYQKWHKRVHGKKKVNGASQKYLNHYFNNAIINILNQKYLNLKKT